MHLALSLSRQRILTRFSPLVVLGTLGYIPRRPRSRCGNFHPTCHPQDLDLGSFDPRVQTRRDQQGLVDRKVVWKEPRRARHVSTGSRIFCQDYRTLTVELGLLDRARSAVHVGTAHLDSLRRQDAFDVALWVHSVGSSPSSELTRSLVWLRPSNQIHAPLFSVKQKRQRRWIVSISLRFQ